jgi:hypothetical protein
MIIAKEARKMGRGVKSQTLRERERETERERERERERENTFTLRSRL